MISIVFSGGRGGVNAARTPPLGVAPAAVAPPALPRGDARGDDVELALDAEAVAGAAVEPDDAIVDKPEFEGFFVRPPDAAAVAPEADVEPGAIDAIVDKPELEGFFVMPPDAAAVVPEADVEPGAIEDNPADEGLFTNPELDDAPAAELRDALALPDWLLLIVRGLVG
jgi:hypothetical protein